MSDYEASAPLGTLRGAFEATGSPSWILRTIQERALDRRHGFALELNLGGDTVKHSLQATEALLAEGAADVADTDWLSIARMRRDGVPVQAIFPYGRIMGGIVVSSNSGIYDLSHLEGRRIGVVRSLDKNWLVVRAACIEWHGFDLATDAKVFAAGSKTALMDRLEQGALDAAVLYWHLIPRLTSSGGFRELHDVLDLVCAIAGVNPPTTFFVCREDFIAKRSDLVRAFVAAYCDAVAWLREDEAAWMEAAGGKEYGNVECMRALRDSWQRRICTSWSAEDFAALAALFDRLKAIGGTEAVGGVDAIPPELFLPAFRN
jgi:NitT/TauT family transport system substrate-binding protein